MFWSCDWSLPGQPEHKKGPYTFVPPECLKHVSAMPDNQKMLHLLHLPVLCSRDLHVLRAQRIVGVFILITHKSTWSENSITRVRRDPIQDGRLIVKRSTDLHGSCLNLFSQWPPQLTSCQGFVYTVFRFSSQYWRDFRLTWNVSDYGGIQSFVTSSRKVWLPDITLYNKYVLVLFT